MLVSNFVSCVLSISDWEIHERKQAIFVVAFVLGTDVDPTWDRFMHKALFKEKENIDKGNGDKTLVLGYCFSVQSAIDHLASFEKMKPAPSLVGYKSLILFSSGDVVVAFGPIIVEFTVIFASVDPRTPPRTH
jgi:hypothetical protein